MSPTFSLSSIPAAARADALADAFRNYRMSLNLRLDSHSPRVNATFSSAASGSLQVETFETWGMTGRVERRITSRHEGAPTTTTFHLLESGDIDIHQAGRRARPALGQLVVSSSDLPFSTDQRHSCVQHTFTVDNAELGISSGRIRELVARGIPTTTTLASITAAHLGNLATWLKNGPSADWAEIRRPTIDMMRALLISELDEPRDAREPLARSLTERIVTFMRSNLGDDELSATMIAREHGISVRYLYMLLGVRGITAAEWIRSERIEWSKRMLRSEDMPIGAIASRVGFSDQSRFSRTFRSYTGMSPSEWRSGAHGNP